ncbi:RluA family pseudouridine synthase [Pacificimonas sp. WHA3]|uniref:RluA family pseudouridine synthase n=1 Tax=Pacificimonas pallii TaxID=2827236 RepID=A0ABS6SDF5_9SPHN|nr:RluA family pseudouridine synthase [Pacificimonas pallii]MBV7256371.1 RluA family pseudouridine synthase [Pacificimonas pallii]
MSSKSPFPILHEDAELLVIDKPAGLAVHPGPKTPRSLEDHLDDLRLGFQRRPSPAHRLDRDTSGCLVLARNPKALKRMHGLFEAGAVAKIYLALLNGIFEGEGEIDAPLTKISSKEKGWRMVVTAPDMKGAKKAMTRWRALEVRDGKTLAEFRPQTGRTHQLRIHAAHALAPICGDPVYGDGEGAMKLHAARIAFDWRGGRRVEAEAERSFFDELRSQ